MTSPATLLAAFVLLALGCNFTSNLTKVIDVGVVVCRHPAVGYPEYRMDTGGWPAPEYVHGLGVPSYVEFVDLNTGKYVQLRTDTDWKCGPEYSEGGTGPEDAA